MKRHREPPTKGKGLRKATGPRLAGGLFLMLLMLSSLLWAQEPKEPTCAWHKSIGFKGDTESLTTDLNLDRRLEILQVDAAKHVLALDAEDGHVIWSKNLGNYTLLTPIAGNFLGNGRINVIISTTGGKLFVLDGPTGDVVGTYDCGFALAFAPTVFPWTQKDDAQPYREGILLYDPARKLVGYLVNPKHGLDPVIPSFDTGGLLLAPPVVGKTGLNAQEPHISFVTYDGQVFVFSGRQPEKYATIHIAKPEKCQTGVTLGNLNKSGVNYLVLADTGGFLHAMAVQNDKLAPVWKEAITGAPAPCQTILTEPKYCPVTIDVNGDHIDDILIPRDSAVGLIDGATGLSLWDPKSPVPVDFNHSMKIESPPAVFHGENGQTYMVFCDSLGVCMLNLGSRTLSRLNIDRAGQITPLVGPFGEKGEARTFVRTATDGAGYMIDLGLNFKPGAPPYMGWRAGNARTCSEDDDYQAFRMAQLDELSKIMDRTLSEARSLAGQRQWQAALEKVDEVLATNPFHREARSLHLRYYIRNNILWIVMAALASLAIIGYAGWVGYRFGRAALEHLLARKALHKDKYEQAIRLYHSLCIRFPRKRIFISQLANIYIHQKVFNAESAVIFERARRFFPEDDRYLKALATAYSSIPRHDEGAALIYNEITKITKKPGPWYFILGQTLKQIGRPRESLEAFRKAIIHNHEDTRLPNLMTDLYVQLGIHSPEILPTLDRVLEQRKEDRAFLKTYCQACQDARRYDEQAQQIARLLLELDPAAPSAHIILATRLLQSGQQKDAMLHAQQVLQVNPNDSIGLRLLGACYAAERRLDETAMKIFAKALQSNPDAPEILLAVSHGFIQEEREDAAAREIYKKALVHSPQDETILTQLAHIAAKENDDDLTIRAVEPLLTMGKRTRELVMQLADAYCRQGIIEDKAEPIYREGLIHQPDHATIQDNLAAIYMRKGRCDTESATMYESVLARHPERFDIGLQLMHCYHKAELPEKTLDLGQRMADLEPENSEMLKLIAAASEKADQMDSAVASYEQVLEDNPNDYESLCALSSLYGRKQRDDNKAIEIYNRAIQIEPRNAAHYLSAVRAYAGRESWDHAIQIIRHLLTQAPDQVSAAITLMENLIERAPKVLKLRWYLIDTMIFEGRLRDAREHLIEILRIDPSQSETALAAFDKILEKNPKDAITNLERGKILLGMGREREADARHAMEQAHRYHPENEEITRNLMGLYQKILEKRDSAEVRFQLGRLSMRVDRYDLAISCFQNTSRDYRWEGESVRNLARCFMAKGMLDLALQELKRLPMEDDVKELLYELGQRYEAVQDVPGAREVYKIIFASDITFRDVKGKLETLIEGGSDNMGAERTAIINSLSEEAKRRYELVQELGRGAMGIVYKARDNELDEFVALKILPDSMIRNAEAVRRFKLEARNARRLAHPNIVRIHDIGEEAGRKYISMEFVQGSDLKHKLREMKRKLPFATVLRYARQICEAMSYAHSIGIVHRDIKPANLMLTTDDQVKVTDFGIAKLVESTNNPESTMVGAIIGTPLYMSPEQVKGQQVDHRADIYSMGVVFYEMASGRPPFTEGDLAYQHLFVEPKPLKEVPEDFALVVMKCLAKDKEGRWQSAKEILDELSKLKNDGTGA